MTVFNTGYATLDEAWGDISGKKNKKKKVNQDPICDLYEMKGNSSSYNETDLVNYNYNKNKSQRSYNDKPETKNVNIDTSSNSYEATNTNLPKSLFEKQFEISHPQSFEMDNPREYMVKTGCESNSNNRDDEGDYIYEDEKPKYKPNPKIYQEQETYQETRPKQKPKETYYDYTDTETDTEDERPRYAKKNIKQERYVYDDEEEYNYKRSNRSNKSSNMYLDIILYILSGIILIFLLEQFVRIGINMQMI
jgi:hypothetical protein